MSKKDLGDPGTLLGDLVREVPVIGWCVVAGVAAGLVLAVLLIPPELRDRLGYRGGVRYLEGGLMLAGGFLGLVLGGVVALGIQHIRGLRGKARRTARRRRPDVSGNL